MYRVAYQTKTISGGDTKPNRMFVCNANAWGSPYCRDYGDDFLLFLGNDHGERGQGNVFYTQLNSSTLFTISKTSGSIHVYDLRADLLSFHDMEESIQYRIGDAACLASSETPSPRLYITGGYTNYSGYYEIYPFFWTFDLEEYSWKRAVDMKYARYRHGCVVVDDALWVMGTVPQIETIDITDIDNSEWSVQSNLSIDANLTAFGVVSTHGISQATCQWYGFEGVRCDNHSVYIIGGWVGNYDSGYNSDTVYIIDTEYRNMSTNALPYSVSALSAVMVKGGIYGFGGWNATINWWHGHTLDHLVKHQMLSIDSEHFAQVHEQW